MSGHYLYGIVRRDLPHSNQPVQASHACIARAVHANEYDMPYGFKDHNLVFLTVANKAELRHVQSGLEEAGYHVSEFLEPYNRWGLTAISVLLTDDTRHILSDLPLWTANQWTRLPPETGPDIPELD